MLSFQGRFLWEAAFSPKEESPMRKPLLYFFLLLLILPLTARAEEAPIELHTPEDLAAIADNPSGNYLLMDDLDMSGISWQGLDFEGTLDGNGHAILNLSPSLPGEEHPVCYDGNRLPYEPEYFGLFSCLRNATVRNLNLINVRTVVETQQPTSLAGLAGYAENCLIQNCTVTGTLELRAYAPLLDVAGLIGYGNGTIENCQVDVTLICVDTDTEHRDEQFLGGIYGHGFFHVLDCQITIDGYVSEFGYCHNGGIGGMHARYPLTHTDTCEFFRNTVSGKITFFEQNNDPRAYCNAFVGEYLDENYSRGGNTQFFLRDFRWQSDRELRPCMCDSPAYSESVTEADCQEFGYTAFTCQSCGYHYRDKYTRKIHTPGPWEIVKEPTTQSSGTQIANCIHCGYLISENLEPLTQETIEATVPPTEPTPVETVPAIPAQAPNSNSQWFFVVGGAVLPALIVFLFRNHSEPPKGKSQQ